ncbi:Uncharacterised protein [Bordetella pertussis]|nr:Uncharacterised protein [Bordetella pertussis]
MFFRHRHGLEGRLAPGQPLQRRAGQPQLARGGLDLPADIAPFGGFARVRQAGRLQRAGEVQQLVSRHTAAQEPGRGIGQLVRLVENHRIHFGQQVCHALLAQHQVGHEQRMVHDHHVGLLRLAARLDHEAVADARALLAQAVLARGGHALPDIGVFGHLRQLGAIAGLADAGKHLDLAQLADLGARLQGAVVALQAVEVVVADIVAAPLEQRGRHRRGQRLPHLRQVAREQLVLQGARAGGNQHLAALREGGHQIGPGLADAGAGLGHQGGARRDGAVYGLRQLDLRLPRPVARHGARQRAVVREEFRNVEVQH